MLSRVMLMQALAPWGQRGWLEEFDIVTVGLDEEEDREAMAVETSGKDKMSQCC